MATKKKRAAPKKQYEKTVMLDLWIKSIATPEDKERYNGLVIVFSNELFQLRIGEWGGRESCLGKPVDGLAQTHYWSVLESKAKKAETELKRMVKNFKLGSITKLKISEPIDSQVDCKKQIEQGNELIWRFFRD